MEFIDPEEVATFKNTIFEYTVDQATPINVTLPAADGGHGTLEYTLGAVTGGPAVGTGSATAIIAPSDPMTGITLSVSPEAIGEDDGQTDCTITAVFNGGVMRTEATAVTLRMEDTATQAEDYRLTGAPITEPTRLS